MPIIQFKGKTAVESYHRVVPHHTLEIDAKLSPAKKPGLVQAGLAGLGADDLGDPLRPGDVFPRRREDLVRLGDLLRVDERLAVETEIGGLPARGLEAGVVVEIEMHAVQRGHGGGARREHAELEARQERESVTPVPRAEVLRQVRGAHDQRADAQARPRE